MATHPSILAWRIPWTEEPDGLQSVGLQKSQTQLNVLAYLYCDREFLGHSEASVMAYCD